MVSIIPTYSQQWYDLRKTHVGASEIGDLLGVSPYADASTVWRRKHDPHFLHPESGINTLMWWGHQDEPGIIKAALAHMCPGQDPWHRTGLSWCDTGFMVSPDAVVTNSHMKPEQIIKNESHVIEAKSVGVSSAQKWRNGPPKHVLAQIYAQMAMTDSSSGTVAARICGAPVRIWQVGANPSIHSAITSMVREFWRWDEKPPHWDDYVADILELAGWRKPDSPTRSKEIEIEDVSLLLDWEQAKRTERAARSAREELDEQVRALFADDDALTMMGNTLAQSSTVRRESLDTTALCLDHPGLYDRYKKVAEYKVYKKTPNLENLR